MSSNALTSKDVNVALQQQHTLEGAKPDIKSMDYHRQMLANKMAGGDKEQAYVSPSDNIMSPCTAKLSAYRSKQVFKAKPKSLFAKASSKNIDTANMFGDVNKTDSQ